MENHIDEHYFDKFSGARFNSEKKMIYFIGIGTKRVSRLNPSSQFVSNSYPRKSSSLSNYLKKKCDRMKMLLKINNMIQNEVVDTSKVINNNVSFCDSSTSKANDDAISILFVKDSITRPEFGDDSSIMNLIKYVKESEKMFVIKDYST